MTDPELVAFLQWALPRMRLRWRGFRKVRRQVRKRVARRMRALGLEDLASYRARLLACPGEWEVLDGLCRVTISRFYRDRAVFQTLIQDALPALAERADVGGDRRVRAWSAGCASGEEPYTLRIGWDLCVAARHPRVRLEITATDAHEEVLRRARIGEYDAGSLQDLPAAWLERAFHQREDRYLLGEPFRRKVTFLQQDIRRQMPGGPFHLVLCRNLALTYFAEPLQREVVARICQRMAPGALLCVGSHENLPDGIEDLTPWRQGRSIYVRGAGGGCQSPYRTSHSSG